jgi:hypothetical protein
MYEMFVICHRLIEEGEEGEEGEVEGDEVDECEDAVVGARISCMASMKILSFSACDKVRYV